MHRRPTPHMHARAYTHLVCTHACMHDVGSTFGSLAAGYGSPVTTTSRPCLHVCMPTHAQSEACENENEPNAARMHRLP